MRDGNNKERPPIGGKMCGYNLPQPITGSGNELFIEFHPKGYSKKGFQIQLKEGKISQWKVGYTSYNLVYFT